MANSAQKYSQALFSIVSENGQLEKVRTDFDEVVKSVRKTPGFITFMNNPRISREDRRQAVAKAFGNASEPLRNMLLILSDRNRFNEIEAVHSHFIQNYNAHYNQENVVIESVYPLSDEEIESIGKVFIKKTGLSKLLIENRVNESLIGGIRVFIGTKVYDGSVNAQLSDLKNRFRERTNS
ncbi:ATP synthase F1 subunit delta [Salinicoccus sp. ID82-1]|uniref:ATP synthase F1 subunit delta n=1 Tax=Salinicoccus sp. ID82-1 TaxID=2820269 RepID=UPI001F01A465|nr:ATP synthase F1 subunit delta [Salinicoccus sp. ID82-1]MCG1009899.1 ATP synthase F1 subunit delta [Salinicoccus sp. ID82-1]